MAPAKNCSKFAIFAVVRKWLLKQVHVQNRYLACQSLNTAPTSPALIYPSFSGKGFIPLHMMPVGASLLIVKKALGIARWSPGKSRETESWTRSWMFPFPLAGNERKALEDSLPVVEWDGNVVPVQWWAEHMGAASCKKEVARLHGIKQIPWLCEAPLCHSVSDSSLLLWIFPSFFYLFFWSVHWLKRSQTMNSPSALKNGFS